MSTPFVSAAALMVVPPVFTETRRNAPLGGSGLGPSDGNVIALVDGAVGVREGR
jgi:hypothetical protein